MERKETKKYPANVKIRNFAGHIQETDVKTLEITIST